MLTVIITIGFLMFFGGGVFGGFETDDNTIDYVSVFAGDTI